MTYDDIFNIVALWGREPQAAAGIASALPASEAREVGTHIGRCYSPHEEIDFWTRVRAVREEAREAALRLSRGL